MSENMVYIIDKNKAIQKKVTLGPNLGKYIVILDGLKPGDSIVAQGIQNLRQGTEVTVDNSTSPAGGRQ